MPQLDQDLRAGLAALAPAVPTDGVFDQVAASHRGRERRRRGRRVGALIAVGAASIALVLGLVPGGGLDESDRVVAGPDRGEMPRLVPTWLPEGFELHSVVARPIRPSPLLLRAQVFTGTGDEGLWRLQVATSTAPIDELVSHPLTVRGVGGRGERPSSDSLTTVQWEEDGRHYEVHGSGLDLGQTVRLVEELEIRDGDRAGVELPGREMVEDHDPQVAYRSDAVWFDYTFMSPAESDGFRHLISIYVWYGIPSDTTFGWPGHETEEITVRRKPARLTSVDGSLTVRWWETPDTHVTIVTDLTGPLDHSALLRLAEDLRQVDQAAWDAFVASGSEQPAQADPGTTGEVAGERPGPTRTSTPAGAGSSAPAAACSHDNGLRADVDGDGQLDTVEHVWEADHALLRACTSSAGILEREGLGQAETLQLIDASGDGRVEILFGTTSTAASHQNIAVVLDGTLQLVTDSAGQAVEVSDGWIPTSEPVVWHQWGCERGRLVLIRAEDTGTGIARWERRELHLDPGSATATTVETTTGETPAPETYDLGVALPPCDAVEQ